jgi:hypothetical protein
MPWPLFRERRSRLLAINSTQAAWRAAYLDETYSASAAVAGLSVNYERDGAGEAADPVPSRWKYP